MPSASSESRIHRLALTLVIGGAFVNSAASAADQLDEVIVSARKRDENLQQVPISIVALDGEWLSRSHAHLMSDVVQSVPNLQLQFLNPRQTSFSIRGIGSNPASEGLETSVGLYLDGVYISRPGMLTSELDDIEQVTVLRGPQGTLFGKNTTAGAISITTRRPERQFNATAELTAGDYDLVRARANLTGPLGASWSWRVAAFHAGRDGTIDSTDGSMLNGLDKTGGRAQLMFESGEKFDLRFIADYARQHEDTGAQVLVEPGLVLADETHRPNDVYVRSARFGFTPEFEPFARRVDISQQQTMQTTNRGLSIEANWRLNEYTLTALSAWRDWEFLPINDLDYLPLDIQRTGGFNVWNDQLSQELRLASPSGRALDYVVGVFLYRQRVETQSVPGATWGSDAAGFYSQPNQILPAYALEGLTTSSRAEVDTESLALFGQLTWHLADAWALTAGARSTWDDKEAHVVRSRSGGSTLAPGDPLFAPITAARNQLAPPPAEALNGDADNTISGLLSLSYQPLDRVLMYASLARGVKSSGLSTLITPPGVNPVVKPEIARNAEIGVKSTLANQSVRLNFDLFLAEIDDYQTQVRDPVFRVNYLANAEAVRSRGAELEAEWLPFGGLRFSTALAFNEATYRSFRNSPCGPEWTGIATQCDLTGKPVSGAPRWSGAARTDFSHRLGAHGRTFSGGIDYTYKSSSFSNTDDSSYGLIPEYGLLNLQLGLRSARGSWEVTLWGRNLLDENYFTSRNGPIGIFGSGYVVGTLGDPRTFGATLRVTL